MMKTFFLKRQILLSTCDWSSTVKKQETLVEHLDYDRYSEQRKANFARQSQQAANDQRAYDKTMEKHRRVKQNVETALRATKDSTAGRLLAKKMKTVLSRKTLRKASSVHDPKVT